MKDIVLETYVVQNSAKNAEILLDYVNRNAEYGRRIFKGDFTGFDVDHILNMFGFTTKYSRAGIRVLKLRCLEKEEDNLIALLKGLE